MQAQSAIQLINGKRWPAEKKKKKMEKEKEKKGKKRKKEKEVMQWPRERVASAARQQQTADGECIDAGWSGGIRRARSTK